MLVAEAVGVLAVLGRFERVVAGGDGGLVDLVVIRWALDLMRVSQLAHMFHLFKSVTYLFSILLRTSPVLASEYPVLDRW